MKWRPTVALSHYVRTFIHSFKGDMYVDLISDRVGFWTPGNVWGMLWTLTSTNRCPLCIGPILGWWEEMIFLAHTIASLLPPSEGAQITCIIHWEQITVDVSSQVESTKERWSSICRKLIGPDWRDFWLGILYVAGANVR
jgi:hypothetical protein